MIMQQRGAALLLVLLVLTTGLALALMGEHGQARSRYQAQHAAQTSRALAQARLALVAWSLSHKATIYNNGRPGELPCPDLHPPGEEYEGWAGSGTDETCNTPGQRLGRLPWKTLGLPKLIDGAGEALWYMVVSPFHDSETAALNSSTSVPEPLQAHADAGTAAYPPAIAIVFAPGSMLNGQSRSMATEQLEPRNYLDASGIYNNASLQPQVIRLNGPVLDSFGRTVFNDQLVTLAENELLPMVMQRVLQEYPIALKAKYPVPPYPAAREGTCSGTPPDIEIEGADANWLARNLWETFLVYQCTDMTVLTR